MASPHSNTAASAPSSLPTRVSPEPSGPARVAADVQRRSSPIERSLSPSARQDEGRSGERDSANAGARSRIQSRNDAADDISMSEEDGEYESSTNTHRRTPSAQPDEFSLTSVPLDTWVGRYVRITTARHNGQTGLVHRTGNGWVNLQTAGGEVAKRAYDLLVIPEERANITPSAANEKGESASRGKRYRASKDPTITENTSASGDDRKAPSRGRNVRTNASTAHSSSDSSGQDDEEDEEGDEHEKDRTARRRGRGAVDGSDFDEGDDADDDDADDAEVIAMSKNSRSMIKSGGGSSGAKDRFGGGEAGKDSGKSSGRKFANADKGRARSKADQDKMRDRDRGRGSGDQSRSGSGRDRDCGRDDNYNSLGRSKGGDAEAGVSRTKRKDANNSSNPPGDSDDKLVSGGPSRERVDRSKDKPGALGSSKKDEGMKNSWLTQIAKAKDRPNLVRWREELVPITKDSSEDFEDATLSVELMKARCDVCYHEKADGDNFCWNEQCWRSPIFFGYFKSGPFGSDDDDGDGIEIPSTRRIGYMNTFGRETVIDSALTSALQAPVKWLETERKRKLDTHEVFSEDPALYRWQCWASTFPDPNSKDPTFVAESKSRGPEKRIKSGHPRHAPGPRLSSENNRSRAYDGGEGSRMHPNGDGHDELEHSARNEFRRKFKHGIRDVESQGAGGLEAMDIADSMHRQREGGGHEAARRGWN